MTLSQASSSSDSHTRMSGAAPRAGPCGSHAGVLAHSHSAHCLPAVQDTRGLAAMRGRTCALGPMRKIQRGKFAAERCRACVAHPDRLLCH